MDAHIQVTLTVSEAKRLIAHAIANLKLVQAALSKGKILLKGGTTVSAVAEELSGRPLKISGRISPRGTRGSANREVKGHCLLLTAGKSEIVDDRLKEVVETLNQGDVVIIGANAIDAYGNAAMCIGAPLGGAPGEVLAGIMGYGATVIIAAGLEKLIPGRISDAVMAAGRNSMQQAHGMAVGMVPLVGRVFTEIEAITSLGNVSATVIAKGGIDGAEGATTMVIAGDSAEIAKVAAIINKVKGSSLSGMPESMIECAPGTGCRLHKGCIYRLGKKEF